MSRTQNRGKTIEQSKNNLLGVKDLYLLRSHALSLLFTILIIAGFTNIAVASTYHVDNINGSDSNAGTSSSPWKTVQRAFPNYTGTGSKVTQGDVVIIQPGQYGAVSYNGNGTGSRTDWITYKAANSNNKPILRDLKIINAPNAYLKWDGMQINSTTVSKTNSFAYNSSYIQLLNSYVVYDGSLSGSAYALCLQNAADITIDNCEVVGAKYNLLITYGDNIFIRNSIFRDTRNDGMFIRYGSNIVIENCHIYDIDLQRTGSHQDAIAVTDTHGIVLRGNKIGNGYSQGLYFCDDFGTRNSNVLIENNLIYGSFLGRSLQLEDVTGLTLVNNTFAAYWSAYPGLGTTGAIVAGSCSNIVAYNNIFQNTGSGLYGTNSDNNYNIHQSYNGANLGNNSLTNATLNFANASNYDFRLTENSVAINFGNAGIAPLTDLLGNTRIGLPDAGCYEYLTSGTGGGDTIAPSIVSVNASQSSVNVIFDERLSTASAENIDNYNINNGIIITNASVNTDLKTVTLDTTGHTENTLYSLTVNAVQDIAGNAMAATTKNYQYDNGLVSYWKFDDANGPVAKDSTSTGNTGTLINNPTWTAGQMDGAIEFAPTDQAVEIETNGFSSTQGTITLWAYPDAFPTSTQFLFGHVAEGWNNRIQIYTNSAQGALGIGLGDTHRRKTDISNLSLGTWHHIALSWDQTNYIVYVDGTEQASGTYTGLSTLNTYADIGNTGYNSDRNEGFDGTIDEVRVYSRALNSEEILSIFNKQPSLIFYPIGNKVVNEGESLTFDINTVNPNTEILLTDHNLPSQPTFIENYFDWTTTYDDAGIYDATFLAPNGELEDFETITITVNNVNRKPIIEPVSNKSVYENSSLAFSVNTSDLDGDNVLCTADNLPSGAIFVDQNFQWTPSYSQAGIYLLSFIATDGQLEDVETVIITVNNANRPPVLGTIGDRAINENETLVFTVNAADPDGDALTYSAENLPTGAVFSQNTFTWTPTDDQSGTYQLSFIASDGDLQDSESITISVNDSGTTPPDTSTGLIGYWKLDEGIGIVAADSSGMGNIGRLIDNPNWTTGKLAGAINIVPTDQAIEVGTAGATNNQGTVTLWAYPTAFPRKAQFLFGHVSGGWKNRIQIYTNNTSGALGIGLGNKHRQATGIYNLSKNTWYHIAITWDGSDYAVYVNGTQHASGKYSGLSTLSPYADIGNTGYRSDRHEAFSGTIDDVRFYNRPLTEEQVNFLFANVGQ